MERLFDYYMNYSEENRLVKDKTHNIEFITTTFALDNFINANSSILDVGAGTGRYSIYFAERGHLVHALEYVPHNLQIMQEKLQTLSYKDNIQSSIGDGRDLSRFEDQSFDVVLCMGPYYHLSTEEDRRRCLSECIRVLKKDGILALAYLNKFASFMYEFKGNKDFLRNEASEKIIDYGYFNECGRENFYFTTPNELAMILQDYEVEQLKNIATDGIGHLFKSTIEGFDAAEYQLWIDYHLKTCAEPSILGYSLHALSICRKK